MRTATRPSISCSARRDLVATTSGAPFRAWIGLLGLVTLLACGGGGGGGSSPAGPTVNVSTHSLNFAGFMGGSFGSQSLTANMSGGTGTYYLGAESTISQAFQIDVTPVSQTSATVTFYQRPGYAPSVGRQDGTVTFSLYSDQAGQNRVWSGSIDVHLTMFSVDVPSLAFAANQTASAAATAQIHLTPADTAGYVTVSSPGGAWLQVTRSAPDTFDVAASPSGLEAGSYPANLQLTARGAAKNIPVTFDVASGIQPPTAKNLSMDARVAPGDLSGSFPVAFKDGKTPTWSAESDRPWLALSNNSGTGPGTFGYTIDPALINGGDPHWTSDTATVTLRAAGLSPVTTHVLLTNDLPFVFKSQPAVLEPGKAAAVHLYGKGFSRFSSGSGFSLSGIGAVSTKILSDTHAVLDLGPLPAGHYAIQPELQVAAHPLTLDLVVNAPVALPEGHVYVGNQCRSAVFDPTRNAFFALTQDGHVVRAVYDPAAKTWSQAWSPQVTGSVGYAGDLGLSPDHTRAYVSFQDVDAGVYSFGVAAVDLDTLAVVDKYPAPQFTDFYLSSALTQGAAATRNNLLWFFGFNRGSVCFDMTTRTFPVDHGGVSAQNSSSSSFIMYVASEDGGRMLMGDRYLRRYDADLDQFSADALEAFGSVQLNRDGTQVLVDGELLRSTADGFAVLGAVSDGSSTYLTDGIISGDGTRAYRAVWKTPDPTYEIVDHVDVFDLTQGGGSTAVSYFKKIGSIPVSGDLSWTTDFGGPKPPRMIPNALGDTLFLMSDSTVYVLPIPQALRPAGAAGPRLEAVARRTW